MDIKEMEEKGVMDNWLELRGFIREFLDQNYPLSQEDLRSILQEAPTDNVTKRQETYEFLNEAMEEVLREATEGNSQIIDGANQGNFTQYTTEDVRRQIFDQKQQMLELLWKKQHPEEQLQSEQGDTISEHGELTTEQNRNSQDSYQVTETEKMPEQEQGAVHEIDSEQTGQQLIDGAVEQSQAMDIRADEISASNREINQAERAYIQMQQGMENGGMSIGE